MLAKRSAGRLSNSRIACCTSDKSVTCQYCSFPCFTFVSVIDRKSTRLNSSHDQISYAVFCLKKKKKKNIITRNRKSRKLNNIKDQTVYHCIYFLKKISSIVHIALLDCAVYLILKLAAVESDE